MNIFYLDPDPVIAAQMQCDRHVIKMALETTQILSTVCGGPYKPTHAKHPSVLWAAQHQTWTYRHLIALLDEYAYRYGKRHKCADIAPQLTIAPYSEFTPPPQCMPEKYRQADTVQAYRDYYKAEKAYFAKWEKGRSAPDWWTL